MLKGDHRQGDVPFGGSPAQCVPVHFHHVVPAEHGVAFSPALWETSPSLSLFFVLPPPCVCVCVCVWDAVALCCPELSAPQTPHPRASSVDWPQSGCVACSDECYPQFLYQSATNAAPKACLLDSVGLPSGVGGTFYISCPTSPLFSLLFFVSLSPF